MKICNRCGETFAGRTWKCPACLHEPPQIEGLGMVSAKTVITSGKINGTVTAAEKIQILKPGILIGDIRTPAIAIEDGAHFHGMCDMGAPKWVDQEPPSPNKNVYDLTSHRGKIRSSDL